MMSSWYLCCWLHSNQLPDGILLSKFEKFSQVFRICIEFNEFNSSHEISDPIEMWRWSYLEGSTLEPLPLNFVVHLNLKSRKMKSVLDWDAQLENQRAHYVFETLGISRENQVDQFVHIDLIDRPLIKSKSRTFFANESPTNSFQKSLESRLLI